ncbi:MAG: ATP-grasp domain-containing protein [Candidatus Bathyarchaeota archaeon]|nr:ATP-grasp domain-containing protein [Candidatus Bathyarchaeota archaeon]
MKRIIITGVGGAAGISILLSLKRSSDYYLIGVDADPYASGQILSSAFHVIPKANDPLFIPALLNLSQGCDALFCTVDEEIPVISRVKKEFNCKVFVSEYNSVEECLNKLKSAQLMKDNCIPIPKTWPYEKRALAAKEAGFPLIVKPIVGRGSEDVFKVSNLKALNAVGRIVEKKMLVQEYLSEPEYTVDVLADEQSQLKKIVARERIRVKSGVATVSRIVDSKPFIEPINRILTTFNLKYIFMVQFRSDPVRVIEIGPRPAGTLILSTESDANMPLMLVENTYDENVCIPNQTGIWYYRLNQGIVFKGQPTAVLPKSDLTPRMNLI